MKKIMLMLVLLPSMALLGGCAASSQSSRIYSSEDGQTAPISDIGQRHPSSQPASSQPGYAHPDSPAQDSANTAVAGLLQQAARARANGDFARAQTLAERAQTLAPHEARSYLELSRIYQERGDSARSRQMALRGLSVVGNDPEIEQQLQLLSAP